MTAAVSSYNPSTGRENGSVIASSRADVARAVAAAARATRAVEEATAVERAGWLRSIARALESDRLSLIDLAHSETGISLARLESELSRTVDQLHFYGDVAVEGSFLRLAIDEASDNHSELVRVNRPLGVVAVFSASNLPFAFGIVGNDTAAAIAAGCPVVVKAHPAHVLLSERLVDLAIDALRAAGAPTGAFAGLFGHDAGVDLVTAPDVKAVAFTGSEQGGLALWRLANSRDVVIPVYAEMGTVNAVVVTRAGAKDVDNLATSFVASITTAHGQICTKPGLLFVPKGSNAVALAGRALRDLGPNPVMLTREIADSLHQALADLVAAGAIVETVVGGDGAGWRAPAAVLSAPIENLRKDSRLLKECFGAIGIVVEYGNDGHLEAALEALPGGLAASVMDGGVADRQAESVARQLAEKVGRIAFNEWPPGAPSAWAQQHGGPWPATSNGGSTSVGAGALDRFTRPVAYQSAQESQLPVQARRHLRDSVPFRLNGILQLPVRPAL